VAQDATLIAPSPTPVVLDRDGAFITQVGHREGDRIDYGYWIVAPPPRVVAATIALEDQRFWYHPGIDPLAVARAAWQHLTGRKPSSGASTIAMQVARMQHPRPRTLWAKAVEAGVAVALTARYGHEAVLAQYLRLAPYGQSSHGIGHAAWWYYGRPAADLDWPQAAMLAAVPQSPTQLAPRRGNPRTLVRASLALARLAAAWVVPAGLVATEDNTRAVPPPHRPRWTALALRLAARARSATEDGVPILHATIDLRLQTAMATLVAAQMRDLRNFGAQQTALMVVDRRSREVLAAIPAVAHAPGAAIDFLGTLRSPGSTEKPFLYALAMDRGALSADELLFDLPGLAPGIANADHAFLGPMRPREALANSRNVPAAVLLRRTGLDAGFEYLRTLGLHDLDGPPIRFGLGMAIGAVPTTLERLVRAYTALANEGQWRELSWLDTDIAAPPRPVISMGSARTVTRFLSDPMARLPTFPRYGSSEYPLAVAVKTGTSQGYRDAWTVAWSDKLVVGAWVGRPDASPMARVSGSRAAARLVQAVLLELHQLNRADLVAGEFQPAQGDAERHADTHAQTARLAVISPPPDTHVWRNPETPDALNRLVLRASASPRVPQVTWMVDGAPVATNSPDAPFYWPMVLGRHRFQVRLPLEPGESAAVAVTVE
jgi:penicillin-binding protein 1C